MSPSVRWTIPPVGLGEGECEPVTIDEAVGDMLAVFTDIRAVARFAAADRAIVPPRTAAALRAVLETGAGSRS